MRVILPLVVSVVLSGVVPLGLPLGLPLALPAGAGSGAHAAQVQVQLFNATNLSFDYSLQMAHYRDEHATQRAYLGKQLTPWIGYEPILGPSAVSPFAVYVTTSPGEGSDAISLNLRGRAQWSEQTGWRYMPYGLRARILGGPHRCDVHAGGPIHDGETILLDLRTHWFWSYALHEILPNGDSCTFYLGEDFGPVVWGPGPQTQPGPAPRAPATAPSAAVPEARWAAEIPGVTRALSGAELAMQAPSLRDQLDADYLRVTGVDLRAVRARHAEAAPARRADQPRAALSICASPRRPGFQEACSSHAAAEKAAPAPTTASQPPSAQAWPATSVPAEPPRKYKVM